MAATTIKLITQASTQNEYGAFIHEETSKEIFAERQSITRSEFFDGGRAGLNPALAFVVISGDYDGQKIIEYNDERYTVYRTYESGDYIELYVEIRTGA